MYLYTNETYLLSSETIYKQHDVQKITTHTHTHTHHVHFCMKAPASVYMLMLVLVKLLARSSQNSEVTLQVSKRDKDAWPLR